ncbi:hypothetical protein HK100_006929, partial [Physocladia obscura]
MAGVRGFSDPNVQVNSDGLPVWQQAVDAALTTNASYLLPFYLNYQGGSFLNATQCMIAGSNGWSANHAALNGGLNNHWATNNTPWSWGHFRRSDIPVQYAIADAWTVGDMYQEAVIAATNPNRVTWASGSINVPGSPQNKSQGGYPYIDNNETPGCETGGFNCYPLTWKTTAEYYEDAEVAWSIFQDSDNFDDNPLAWFGQFQTAADGSDLYEKGFVGQTLDDFYARAANGTLPAISYIIGPTQLSEHPPFSPRDGAWLQKQIVDAVTQSPAYAKTVLMISFDESGGWGDHVTPFHSPAGTPGEWLNDPYGIVGYTYSGPGYRLPFYIVSPWTRGGNVFTEHADHNSQILFIEEWLASKGVDVTTSQMVPWRRQHMSNLVNAFDFENPDHSVPELPDAPLPHTNSDGVYDGSSYCQSLYAVTRPDVPYGDQIAPSAVHTLSEQGFKNVRGDLTEGRYLTFESFGYALANAGGVSTAPDFAAALANAAHDSVSQRWILYALSEGGNVFAIQSALDSRFFGGGNFTIVYGANNLGYSIQNTADGNYVAINEVGAVVSLSEPTAGAYFSVFSVTYDNNSTVVTTTASESTAVTTTTSPVSSTLNVASSSAGSTTGDSASSSTTAVYSAPKPVTANLYSGQVSAKCGAYALFVTVVFLILLNFGMDSSGQGIARKRELYPYSVFDEAQLRKVFSEQGANPVHINTIYRHIIQNGATTFDAIPEIPQRVLAVLRTQFVMSTSTVERRTDAADGSTTKLVVRLQDGQRVETVVMRYGAVELASFPAAEQQRRAAQLGLTDRAFKSRARATACLSSQAGCAMGCTFCATGTMGLVANLAPAEIVEQLVHANAVTRIRNVVFMGMGEPLDNYAAVRDAIAAMVHTSRFSLSPTRITVSTVGVAPRIRALMRDCPAVGLALSLHAPDQDLRQQIVPSSRAFPLDKILAAAFAFIENQNKSSQNNPRHILIEYVLIENVNSSIEVAHRLGLLFADRVHRKDVLVNVIPYNPTDVVENYQKPSPETLRAFVAVVRSYGVHTLIRQELGQDIASACGQLVVKSQDCGSGSGGGGCNSGAADLEDLMSSKNISSSKSSLVAGRASKRLAPGVKRNGSVKDSLLDNSVVGFSSFLKIGGTAL